MRYEEHDLKCDLSFCRGFIMNSLLKLKMYNESDSEEEEKLEDRLPLPEFLRSPAERKCSQPETDEEGKIRNFPHEPGNWATYVYIPEDSAEFISYVNALSEYFKPLDLKLNNNFHISLTRTVILRHHWITDFISSVRNSLAEVKSFKIHLFGLKAYINEQKTRSFLSLKVDEGKENLLIIVYLLNKCLMEYNLEIFYEDPSFHISLMWCPGDKVSEINKLIDLLPKDLKHFGFHIKVSYCVCTTGNKKYTFNFS